MAQSIVVVDKDGNQHKFCTDYVQDITFEVVDNRPNYSFSQIDVNPYGGVNVGLELKTAEGVTAAFDLYMADPSVILADGTYIFGATEGNVSTSPTVSGHISAPTELQSRLSRAAQ